MRTVKITITDIQEDFLKLFAAKHISGSKDNKATHNPIHVVQSKTFTYLPYTESLEDYYEDEVLVFAMDKEGSGWYDSEVELVKGFYNNLGAICPIEIKPFKELEYEIVTDVEGDEISIYSYTDYFIAYGIWETPKMAWKQFSYNNVAFFSYSMRQGNIFNINHTI